MGNQYGYTGLTPGLALIREAYRKGLRSGRGARNYNQNTFKAAYSRFVDRYGGVQELCDSWEEGWRDAQMYRDLTAAR
jgi:hypothetical protein